MTARRIRILQRVVLVIAVGALAAFSVSSIWVATIVGALAVAIVLFDMQWRNTDDLIDADALDPIPTPQTFTIDLSKRP